MGADPYKTGMFKESPYYAKSDIESRLVVVLQGKFESRGLKLISAVSRAVCTTQIHELIATDETGARPNADVNRIAYWGFTEITQGGVIIEGDEVLYEGAVIGHIAGFDETHMPNHWNIVVRCDERHTGVDLNLQLGGSIVFRHKKA